MTDRKSVGVSTCLDAWGQSVQLIDLDGSTYAEATTGLGLTLEATRLVRDRAPRRPAPLLP
jgi:hypothetical protein